MNDFLEIDKSDPSEKITTEEQGLNWIRALISDMVKWRENCNVVFPDNKAKTVEFQKRALWTFLTKQGQVVGALKTLMMCGLISERAYKEMNQRAINALIPDVVGDA